MKPAIRSSAEKAGARVDDARVRPRWQPRWILNDQAVGMTVDDGCFVVLVGDGEGYWHPTTHVPLDAAGAISDALSHYISDRKPQ
jgi:hypothetical protein